ncbi:MAG: type II toxin-antitoxin system RelE/ParE family toxin [Candidatus Acidiferrum sp.]
MPYLVRLADRALRDMEAIYEFIEVDTSEKAFAWFNELAETIYSLERFPERGTRVPESKNLRQLFFGKTPNIYRIIFTIDKHNRIANVLHIRHGARNALPAKQE